MATNNKSNFRPDGNLDVQGNLTVRGNILGYGTTTFLNDTVTVNDADGYVINSDSDVDSSYLQLNSQTSNIRLTYNSANLTIGTTGVTNKIVLDANSNVEGTLTTTGNVTGPYFEGIATSAQRFTGNVNLTLDGDLTGSVSFEGPFTDSFAANINANAVILDYHTQGAYVKTAQGLGNSNIIVASQGTDDGQDITIDLVDTTVTAGTYGNATATSGFTVDEKGRLTQANATMIAIPHTQVTDFNATVEAYTTGVAQTITAVKTHEANLNLENNTLNFAYSNSEMSIANVSADVLKIDIEPINITGNIIDISDQTLGTKDGILPLLNVDLARIHGSNDFIQIGNLSTDNFEIGVGFRNVEFDDTSIANLDVDRLVTTPSLHLTTQGAGAVTIGAIPLKDTSNVGTANYTTGYGMSATGVSGNKDVVEILPGYPHNSQSYGEMYGDIGVNGPYRYALKYLGNTSGNGMVFGYANVFEDGTGISSDWANNTLSVDNTVILTNRDATLANSYTFTGTVDLTGATATTVSGTLPSVSGNAYVQGSNDGSLANTSYVETAITSLRTSLTDGATDSLNTLGELATALSNNSNVASAITTQIAAAEANIVTANTELKLYTDTNKTDKTFKIATDGSIIPRHKKADGTIIDSTDASMSNTQLDGNVITFESTTGDSSAKADIFLQTRKYGSEYSVLHQGQQNVSGKISTLNSDGTTMTVVTPSAHKLTTGDVITIQNTNNAQAHGTYTVTKTGLTSFTVPNTNTFSTTGNADGNASTADFFDPNPTADFQKRDGNITFTGATRFMQGRRASEASDGVYTNQQGTRLGTGDVSFFSNIVVQRDSNVGSQSYASNVTTLFFKEEIGIPSFAGGTASGVGVASGNIFTFAHSTDVLNRNADSYGGTINSQVNANTIELGSPRASRHNFEDAVMFIGGDIATYINAQTVTANAGADVYTVTSASSSAGDGLIERLTVDGAIIVGNKVSDTYHANGTIFYDTATNQFKGVEAGVVKTLVDATVNTIDLGSADIGSDANVMTQAGNIFYPAGIKGDYGITVSRVANATANVAVIETSNADIRGLFSVSAGSQGYNSGTGVISVPGTTDHITEGTNLFYTDERVDDRVGALIVGGANITATYDDAGGTLTLDADLSGDITSVTAGTGLTGDATSGDVTLNVVGGTGITANANDIAITNTGVTAGVYGDANKVPALTVNAQGQITGAANTSINITASQVSDFAEAVDDQINVLVSGGANITVTYDDANGTFVIDNDLTGDVTGVVAGAGLTGGGTSGDVTLDVVAGTGMTVNANDIAIDLKDEDNMASNSATHAASQQSIKAYVDSEVLSVTAGNLSLASKTTSDLAEGTNLYYTDERAADKIGSIMSGSGNITVTYDDAADTITVSESLTTTDITEGDNLYFTNARVESYISGGDGIDFASGTIDVDNTVVRTTGAQTIAGAKTFSNDAVFNGNLTVNGTQTVVNTETLTVDDNIIVLNNNEAGTPSQNAGIEVERGTSTNVQLRFNETDDQWQFTNDGTNYYALETFVDEVNLTSSDGGSGAGPILDFYRNSSSAADGDYLGQIKFQGENDADQKLVYAKITGKIDDASDGTEDGILEFANMKAGTQTITARLRSDSFQLLNGTGLMVHNINYPTADGTNGQVMTTDGNGTLSFSTISADITAVTAGVGLSGGGNSGAVTLDLDFSELDDMTGTMDATDEFIILDSGTGEKRKAANEIGLSVFNNDSGFTTNVGDITGVTAGTGMTGGGTSGAVTLNVIGGDGITANADDIAVDLSDTAIFTSTNTASRAVVRDGSGNFAANIITGTATAARYADLAENYLADKPYEPGTVVVIGGSAEVTEVTKQNSPAIAGVVSTNPAHLMNAELEGDNVVAVALKGRVPCKVVGAVRKGDVLIASNTPGHAQAAPFNGYHAGASAIGVAISENLSSGTGVVEALIK